MQLAIETAGQRPAMSFLTNHTIVALLDGSVVPVSGVPAMHISLESGSRAQARLDVADLPRDGREHELDVYLLRGEGQPSTGLADRPPPWYWPPVRIASARW
jgi:hypothetical protein